MAAKIVDMYNKEGGNTVKGGAEGKTNGGAKATKDYTPPVKTSDK